MCKHSLTLYYSFIDILDLLNLAMPPGKVKMQPNPSPILTSKKHKRRYPSVSEEDNVFQQQDEVLYHFYLALVLNARFSIPFFSPWFSLPGAERLFKCSY